LGGGGVGLPGGRTLGIWLGGEWYVDQYYAGAA
jgi:hypothetical protein